MICPKCQSARITPCDLNRSGTQRYECMDCGKKFTPRPAGRTGRKPVGKRAMTNAERQRKWRAKKSQDRG